MSSSTKDKDLEEKLNYFSESDIENNRHGN